MPLKDWSYAEFQAVIVIRNILEKNPSKDFTMVAKAIIDELEKNGLKIEKV